MTTTTTCCGTAAGDWLERDQRTVTSPRRCECCARRRCGASSPSASSRRPFARALHRLGEVLVVGACLLSVARTPGAMTAPLDRQETPIWVDPCRASAPKAGVPSNQSELTEFAPRPKDSDLLEQIVTQAKRSRSHAEAFRDQYVESTFKMKLENYHEAWRLNQYNWLPSLKEIPKSLGEPLDLEYLKTLQLDEALKDTYEYLQKFAVGLEQVSHDQNVHNGEFAQAFKETSFNVRSTLCEIKVAMLERNVTQKPDVTRDIMSEDYRSMDSSSDRNLRDWLIFRDYMNGVEYVEQVFQYIKDHLVS